MHSMPARSMRTRAALSCFRRGGQRRAIDCSPLGEFFPGVKLPRERCEAPGNRLVFRVSTAGSYLPWLAGSSLVVRLPLALGGEVEPLTPPLGVSMRTLHMMASRSPYCRGLQSRHACVSRRHNSSARSRLVYPVATMDGAAKRSRNACSEVYEITKRSAGRSGQRA